MSDRPYNCTKCAVPQDTEGLCTGCSLTDPGEALPGHGPTWDEVCRGYYNVTAALAVVMENDRSTKHDPEARQRWRDVGAAMDALKDALHAYRDGHAQPAASAVEAERDALARFKAYVHQRLDGMGVPTHPEGEHSKAGCRIGDRLDLVAALTDASRTVVDRAGDAFGERHWQVAGGDNSAVLVDRYTDDTDEVRVACHGLEQALAAVTTSTPPSAARPAHK